MWALLCVFLGQVRVLPKSICFCLLFLFALSGLSGLCLVCVWFVSGFCLSLRSWSSILVGALPCGLVCACFWARSGYCRSLSVFCFLSVFCLFSVCFLSVFLFLIFLVESCRESRILVGPLPCGPCCACFWAQVRVLPKSVSICLQNTFA